MNPSKITRLIATCLMTVMSTILGCGTPNDPITTLGDPTAIPTLVLPFNLSTQVSTYTYYTSADPVYRWTFSTSTSIAISAPSAGIITAVDTTPEQASVTIQHSPRFFTRLAKMGTILVKVGDYVAQGASVGVMGTGLILEMTFYRDGGTLCPYPYFYGDSLSYINTRMSTGYMPCGI